MLNPTPTVLGVFSCGMLANLPPEPPQSFGLKLESYKTPALSMPAAIMSKNNKSEDQELSTAPFDPRFPNQNQTRYCYQSFVDFHRCEHVKGEGYEPCQYFKKVFTAVCPNAWIEKWDTQIEEGRFPGKLQ